MTPRERELRAAALADCAGDTGALERALPSEGGYWLNDWLAVVAIAGIQKWNAHIPLSNRVQLMRDVLRAWAKRTMRREGLGL